MFGLISRLLILRILGNASEKTEQLLRAIEGATKRVLITVFIATTCVFFFLIGSLFLLGALFIHLAGYLNFVWPAIWTGSFSIGLAIVSLLLVKLDIPTPDR